jgi:6-phosphofructokinase 1
MPFTSTLDAATGRIKIRMVDIQTENYRVGRRYMLRLRREDFEDPHELAKLAATAGITLDEFKRQFEYVVEDEPPPIQFYGSIPPPESTPLPPGLES